MSQPPQRNGLRLATIGNAIRLETDSLTSEPDASYMYVGLEHIESKTGVLIREQKIVDADIQGQKFRFTNKHILYGKLRPYLRVANAQDGYLDLSEIKTIEVLPEDIDKFQLEEGDILMTEGGDPDKLGRGCIWRSEVKGCIHQNHVFRVRTDRSQLIAEYLSTLLRTQYAKEYFLRFAKRTSNLASINSTQIKAFPIPVPPIMLQLKFVVAIEQWEQIHRCLTDGLAESKKLFQGLMQQTFTGQLTAAWEAAHADRIAAEQTQRERLPQLVILDFVLDRQRHRPGEPVLITSLSKRRGRLGSRSVTLSLTSIAPSLENSIKISKHWRPVGSSLEPRAMKKGQKSL